MLATTLALSCMTNISLLSDLSNVERKTDEIVNALNRAHLIATLYVLKEDPTNSFTKNTEENNMKNDKKIGSSISNRTKVLGGMTILIGAATIISGVKDHLGLKGAEDNVVENVIVDIRDGIEEFAGDIPAEVDNIIS